MNTIDNANYVVIDGKVIETPVLISRLHGIYETKIEVKRKSGVFDQVRIRFQEDIVKNISKLNGKHVLIDGVVRSSNFKVKGKNHLHLFVHASDITIGHKEQDDNLVNLTGFVVNRKFRYTPSGIPITDLMVAYNRPDGNSDYIPCITWFEDAICSANLHKGDKINFIGRMQSRPYMKKGVEMTAFEVSIKNMIIIEYQEAR